jgi:hypothetical protein
MRASGQAIASCRQLKGLVDRVKAVPLCQKVLQRARRGPVDRADGPIVGRELRPRLAGEAATGQ